GVPGSYQVYMSLQNANTDQPDVANAWDTTVTYYADETISYGGFQWRNLLPFNVGLTPADGPNLWLSATTYATGNTVTGSNHKIYSSVGNGNIGNDPTLDTAGTFWTDTGNYNGWSRSPTLTVSAKSWRPIGNAALTSLTFLYPIGSGPASQLQ